MFFLEIFWFFSLSVLAWLCTGLLIVLISFVPSVIPMWNLYAPHDLTQWKCDVYMYRFFAVLSGLFVCFFRFCFVSSHLFHPPPSFSLFSPPLSSPSPLVLTSSSDSFLTRWREMGLRLNTIITISHMKPIYRVTGTRFQLLGSLTFLHQTAAFCFCLICFYLCVLSEKKKKKPC